MATRQRIVDLLHELETYRARYRGVEVPVEVERMNMAIGRRRHRVEAIRSQLTHLIDELSRLEAEIAGCHKGYEALLLDAIERIKIEHHEAWSPFPVIGFRLWHWRDGGLHGAWEQWKTVTKEASCRHDGDLPHSDGSCGRLGCGVYAAKSVESLIAEVADAHGFVAGVVELTGKIVEHEAGYRAARAEVRSAVMVGPTLVSPVVEGDDLDAMFTDPDGLFDAHQVRRSTDLVGQVTALLDIDKERNSSWTSDPKLE